MGVRSKCRTLPNKVSNISQLPEWNYDGSSTNQAVTENSEVILRPCAFFPDPFRGGENILVLCEAYSWETAEFKKLIPANTNFRLAANKIFEAGKAELPWYGVEQEYTLMETTD